MHEEAFFDSVKNDLYFKVNKSIVQGEKCNVLKIKTKENYYYLSAYANFDCSFEKNIFIKMSFDEYVNIVFGSTDVEGVAIYRDGEYIFFNHLYLRWLNIKQDLDDFLCTLDIVDEKEIEEQIAKYHSQRYREHLIDVKNMFDKKAYEKAYNILCMLLQLYPNNLSETYIIVE